MSSFQARSPRDMTITLPGVCETVSVAAVGAPAWTSASAFTASTLVASGSDTDGCDIEGPDVTTSDATVSDATGSDAIASLMASVAAGVSAADDVTVSAGLSAEWEI